MIPEGTDLLAQAESIVAKARAAGADQAEVYLVAQGALDLDVEADAIASVGSQEDRGGAVRLIKDGRLGFGYFSDPADAPRAIDMALRLTPVAPDKGYRLPDAAPRSPDDTHWDDGLAALDTALILDAATEAVRHAKDACPTGTVAGGGAEIGWSVEALCSSEGAAAWGRGTHFQVGVSVALDEDGTGINAWDSAVVETGTLDAAAIGRGVGETVQSLRGPTEPRTGTQDIVLRPDAAWDLIAGVVLPAVDGDTSLRGRSMWSDRLGETVAHPGLSLTDDPFDAHAIGGCTTDGEGLAVRSTPLIADGVLRGLVFDSWDAHLHGRSSTAHAVRSGTQAPPSTGNHHVRLDHADRRGFDALLGDIERGYLVDSVLGAHTANATTGDFSVTAPNVWRIEDGSVVGASQAIAIAGNLPTLLGRLDAVEDRFKRMGGASIPAVRLRDVAVSS